MNHTASQPGLPVLVAGGGVAGMQAALDLASLGVSVHLVEQAGYLGGQVLRLDKVYPTDHCAFCVTWTYSLACREHPLITVDMWTRFAGMEERDGKKIAILERLPRFISAQDCVFCGQCIAACPGKALAPRAADLSWDPSGPPVPHRDASRCNFCGTCAQTCPAKAIDIASKGETLCLPVYDCIFAGGFTEANPAPEFGAHTHPDILTAMAFEELTSECNAEPASPLRCPSDKRPARSLAFIQCAGARDRRHLEYCAAVCCMHAAKQAAWLKRRQPELAVTVLYTDLRAPGKAQEAYVRMARDLGVAFFRRRPGLVAPVEGPHGKGVAVRHECGGRVGTSLVDLVVLNGGLAGCPFPGSELPVFELRVSGKSCGFCAEPADIAHSVIQAGSAAALAVLGKNAAVSTLEAAKEGTS
jgi:heterodisulfide reductase subunit A-like polyferredoxin